jgi:Protein of unknown function DUF115
MIHKIKKRLARNSKRLSDFSQILRWAWDIESVPRDRLNHAIWLNHHASWLSEASDKYTGQDVVLLCNGPSLNKIDFDLLQNKHVIGLNKIHFLLEKHPLKLCFHVAVNDLVIEQSIDDFEKLTIPSYISMRGFMKLARNKTRCNLLSTSTEDEGPHFCTDLRRDPVNEGWTVTFAALQLAYLMGFERVFITGMDHNFQYSGKPNEEQKLDQPDANHFDPRYFSGQKWHLPDLEGSEISYKLAKFMYERKERRIIDATIGGHCQIFDKMDFSQAMSECRPASNN